jgi:hypothetical protein
LKIIDHGIFNLVIAGNSATMDFNPASTRYPEELVNSSFERERRYLLRLLGYAWCPEILEINPYSRIIVFKWYGSTCEESVPDDYASQLEEFTWDLHKEQIYKPNFYTKCFYTDDCNKIRAYAFYSSSEYAEQPIKMDFYQPILNPNRAELVDQLQTDGMLDMGVLIERAFNDYIKWPGDPLPGIYQRVYQTCNRPQLLESN